MGPRAPHGGLPVHIHLGAITARGNKTAWSVRKLESKRACMGKIAEGALGRFATIEDQPKTIFFQLLKAGFGRESEPAGWSGQMGERRLDNFRSRLVAIIERAERAVAGSKKGDHCTHARNPFLQEVRFRVASASEQVPKRQKMHKSAQVSRRAAAYMPTIGKDLRRAFCVQSGEGGLQAHCAVYAQCACNDCDSTVPARFGIGCRVNLIRKIADLPNQAFRAGSLGICGA